MILIKPDTINYFHLFRNLSLEPITREIRLTFFKSELDNYFREVTDVRVDEYNSYWIISFEEVINGDQTDGEVDLAYYPGEWKMLVEQLTEDATEWVTIYNQTCKVLPRESTNKFPNL